jgi:GTP-binding protein EngB required for normal cell division
MQCLQLVPAQQVAPRHTAGIHFTNVQKSAFFIILNNAKASTQISATPIVLQQINDFKLSRLFPATYQQQR